MENTSALKTHFLSSILPYQDIKDASHFLKTKEFYRPEQFIWNNPHRTSKKLFPYFHQSNQRFQQKIKPIMDKLEQEQKIMIQKQRIKKLTQLRNETRQKFFDRQKIRQQLEARSNSRKKINSISQLTLKTYRQQKQVHTSSIKSKSLRNKQINGLISANIEKTYQKGLQHFDANINNIKKLVSNQVVKNHFKIRSQFQKRKQTNDIFNNSINHLRGRKSVGSLKFDEHFL